MPWSPLAHLAALAVAVGLAGCASDPSRSEPTTPPDAASSQASSSQGSAVEPDPLDYLLARYDKDGDGAVSAQEYARQTGQFERWDTDGDGLLTAADWAEEDARIMESIRALQKDRVLGRYFQSDEDDAVMSLDELGDGFAAFDANGDLDLIEAEFEELADARRRTLPGDQSLMMQSYMSETGGWSMLVGAYDDDGSGTVGIEELGLYLESRENGELRFDRDRCDGGAPGERFERVDLARGVPAGDPVPDLELSRLDGEGTVHLADFAGERPVALIFGSYT